MSEKKGDYQKRKKRGMALLKKMGREELTLDQKALYPDLYVTIAANIALARPSGNYSHYRSAKHIGITHKEICEVMIQVGHYAGWPTVSNAVRQYTAVLEEEKEIKAGRKKKRTLV